MAEQGGGHRRRCQVCGGGLKRNGRTSSGKTRWRCTSCGSSSSRSRPDVTRRAQVEAFVAWLTGPVPQAQASQASARSFRRHTAWCWRIEPVIGVTGEVFDEVQLDGIYLAGGWCALIAISRGTVVGLQWCDTEKTAAWMALLERLPAPGVAVVDGVSGLTSALAQAWPDTAVQRCLVHVQRGVRGYLTRHPRTEAGKALRALSLQLTKITTRDQATTWLTALNAWHQAHGDLIKQRTYATQPGAIRPQWARAGQRWWYTHDRIRRAYRLMARLARENTLFTYLDERFDGQGIAATTNQIEGGINSVLRDLLKRHRGMPPAHQKRAVEWWCYLHSERPTQPADLARPEHWNPQPSHPAIDDEPLSPAGYDTTATPEEGLWTRKGWAGRPR
ncbi:IS1249 family transposase [Myceligenerans indicum]|uniref:Mutator family transposase n=1 Tax=Myceligenerans indicum TaxID=2593663 RepID=A0ABS1LTX4_9MICO|nr:IS1249 family transposase [Myceligenerans indicum]MBL0888947.1 IS1249 family transposase [Myceligenerans indicum]